MTREELQDKIKVLETELAAAHASANVHAKALEKTQKKLEDLDKPKLTSGQFDAIHDAIERGLDNFEFDDRDNYTFEYDIDYSGQVSCCGFEFHNHEDIATGIIQEVEKLFAVKEEY